MKKNNISLVVTVLNEEKNIDKFIDSVFSQSKLPDEITIVDGESSDNTVASIKYYVSSIKYKNIQKNTRFKIIVKSGNRAVGRNEAIKKSTGDIILSVDAGCTIDKNWIKNIIKPFIDPKVDVAAGYYKGQAKSIFQKCLIPYVLVMQDKINLNEFLPASRSMAFRKSVWKKIGGFDEKLSHNEDYDFAHKIKKNGFKIIFCKDAIVNWIPRNNLLQSFIMFFRFAFGDAQASIFRGKVIFIFLRYIFAFYLVLLSLIMKNIYLNSFIILCFFLYVGWSIFKNYKYVNSYKAIFYLPLLQFTSDFAVILGTTLGFIRSLSLKSIFQVIFNNKGAAAVIIVYVLAMLLVISYGIPGPNHPFAYFMDEWHQSQAVRNVFKYGTPNIEGSANGSMFHFFLTGIYLIPFFVLKIVDPFSIKSSITQLQAQNVLFEVLRLNTLFFGIASIILFVYISKKYFKLNTFFTAFLFTINPLWINLSNYFKYDIALIFWILASFAFLLEYIKEKSKSVHFMGWIFAGVSAAVKFSAIPVLPIYLIISFLYPPDLKNRIKYISLGVILYFSAFFLFGIPDIILGKGNLTEYLSSNLIRTPEAVSYNFNLGMHFVPFLLLRLYPVTFGHVFYYVFLASIFIIITFFIKKNYTKILNTDSLNTKNIKLTLLFLFFFAISLYPLKFEARANRVLVLLPFIVLIVSLVFTVAYGRIKNKLFKYLFLLITFLFVIIQSYETFSWIAVRFSNEPRVDSSNWIVKNIPKGTVIGIENIPIYQLMPDLIVKEYYFTQYKIGDKTMFKYEIIDSRSDNIPSVVIISNDEIEKKYLKKSDKKDLIIKLGNEGYQKIAVFKPDFRYFEVMNTEFDFYMSGLAFIPNTISIYKK